MDKLHETPLGWTQIKESKNHDGESTFRQPLSELNFLDQTFDNILPFEEFAADKSSYTYHEKIVLFDLETAGFGKSADILQIAAAFGEKKFNIYIKPTGPINVFASAENCLTNIEGELYYRGNPVSTTTLDEALRRFKDFLIDCGSSCVLAAHNCNFDKTRLLFQIRKLNMLHEFEGVIEGFVDTLALFRRVLPGFGSYGLEAIAINASINIDGAHNAIVDVAILQKVLNFHNITESDLLTNKESLTDVLRIEEEERKLSMLDKVISKEMKKRIRMAGITFDLLVDVFMSKGPDGIHYLFSEIIINKPRITKSSVVIGKVVHFLESVVLTNDLNLH